VIEAEEKDHLGRDLVPIYGIIARVYQMYAAADPSTDAFELPWEGFLQFCLVSGARRSGRHVLDRLVWHGVKVWKILLLVERRPGLDYLRVGGPGMGTAFSAQDHKIVDGHCTAEKINEIFLGE
jgi:hypothetical protein